MLDGMLDVIKTCLMHENEALSRIGSTCLQQLIEHNVTKFNADQWKQLVGCLVSLSNDTTPFFLFFNVDQPEGSIEPKFNVGMFEFKKY